MQRREVGEFGEADIERAERKFFDPREAVDDGGLELEFRDGQPLEFAEIGDLQPAQVEQEAARHAAEPAVIPAGLDGVFLDARADGGLGAVAHFVEDGGERPRLDAPVLRVELIEKPRLDFGFQRLAAAVVGEELGAKGEVFLRRLVVAPELEDAPVFGRGGAELLRGFERVGAEKVVVRIVRRELQGEVDLADRVVEPAFVDEVLRLRLKGGRGAAELRQRGGHVALGDEDGDAKRIDEDKEKRRAGGERLVALHEQPELPAEARVLGAGGKAALVGGEVGLELLDRLVAVLTAQRERLHGDGVQRLGHAPAGQVRLAFRGPGGRAFRRAGHALHGRDRARGFHLLQNLIGGAAVEALLRRRA